MNCTNYPGFYRRRFEARFELEKRAALLKKERDIKNLREVLGYLNKARPQSSSNANDMAIDAASPVDKGALAEAECDWNSKDAQAINRPIKYGVLMVIPAFTVLYSFVERSGLFVLPVEALLGLWEIQAIISIVMLGNADAKKS